MTRQSKPPATKSSRETAREEDAPKPGAVRAQPGTMFALDALPEVPADREAVERAAAASTRRFPEKDRAEGVKGLREVAARDAKNPGELGDLGPDPAAAALAADTLESAYLALARLEELTNYVRAFVGAKEHEATVLLDKAHDEATRRVAAGRVQRDWYKHVFAFVEARGEAVAEGIARAKAQKNAAKRDPVG